MKPPESLLSPGERPTSKGSPGQLPDATGGWRPSKIQPDHLDRLAVVYIRQSTPHQVLLHRESRERQYGLVDRAVQLGWPGERVLIVDDDQGSSAKTADHRSGFHRLLAEVTMGHVGLVLGLEMSRLARSNKDWHQLLELCALVGTLLADEDGLYDPNDSNDRLLLGLKGTISEFELVTMHHRLERGMLNKAQRGALFSRLPFGYVKVASDRIEQDPDEQVRAVVRLIFAKYDELGSMRALFRYLLANGIGVGIRRATGPQRGQLEWRRPHLATLHAMLRHPIYAGAYVYGRRHRSRPRAGQIQGTMRLVPMTEWTVLKRDAVPAYITWEQYQANQERRRQAQTSRHTPGAPRGGAALLTGLLICGRCGRRMHSRYHFTAQYICDRQEQEGTERICFGLRGKVLDELVAQQVLQALQPASLELSLQALADSETERARLHQHWQQRRERAGYEAQEAERRYRAVDPENRLVARSLERGWEQALQALRQLEEDYDRFLRQLPPQLSATEQDRIRALAADIPALWHAVTTTNQDRKEMVRLLLEQVVVQVRPDSEYVEVTLHWHGGSTSQHTVLRPVQRFTQLRDYDKLMARLVQLRRAGYTSAQIADQLNHEGFTPPKRRGGFLKITVRQLLARCGLANERTSNDQLGAHEWWLPDLAKAIPMSAFTLRIWARQGRVEARRTPAQGLWVVKADPREVKRLRKQNARLRRGSKHRGPRSTGRQNPGKA